MLSEYLKGYIDALSYPVYRGARDAGCVQIPMEDVEEAEKRIQKSGCIVVKGKQSGDNVEIWVVRSPAVEKEVMKLIDLYPEDKENYHKAVGKLLGYSEQHIRMFLETERPSV